MRFRGPIAALAFVAAGAEAQDIDFSGDLSLQGRWYLESPAFPGQLSTFGGVVAEPTQYAESAGGTNFTFTPFYRYDSADSQRTHADVREAYMLTYGDWGESAWELRLVVDRVFWGVAELNNLVDISTSARSGSPDDGEAAKGQMAHAACSPPIGRRTQTRLGHRG